MTLLDRLDALRVPYRLTGERIRLKKGVELPEWLARAVAAEKCEEGTWQACCFCSGSVRLQDGAEMPDFSAHYWCLEDDSSRDDADNLRQLCRHIRSLYSGLFCDAESGLIKRVSAAGELVNGCRVVNRVRRNLDAILSGNQTTFETLEKLEESLREFAAWEPWSGK